jgi:putative transposase
VNPNLPPIVVVAQPLARLGGEEIGKHGRIESKPVLDQAAAGGCETKRFMVSTQGDLYLAAIKGLWNREIVGYAMSHRMTQDLVGRALFRAVTAKRPPAGLIHHSDRDSQYCSLSYQKLLKQFGMVPSMRRKRSCYDNAPMESFFGTLKTELVHHRKYHTR